LLGFTKSRTFIKATLRQAFKVSKKITTTTKQKTADQRLFFEWMSMEERTE